jgi:hypothetical protein
VALDAFGGARNPTAWTAAFLTMALGSTAAALAMRATRKRAQPAPMPDEASC